MRPRITDQTQCRRRWLRAPSGRKSGRVEHFDGVVPYLSLDENIVSRGMRTVDVNENLENRQGTRCRGIRHVRPAAIPTASAAGRTDTIERRCGEGRPDQAPDPQLCYAAVGDGVQRLDNDVRTHLGIQHADRRYASKIRAWSPEPGLRFLRVADEIGCEIRNARETVSAVSLRCGKRRLILLLANDRSFAGSEDARDVSDRESKKFAYVAKDPPGYTGVGDGFSNSNRLDRPGEAEPI
jgi:hypothetical protein